MNIVKGVCMSELVIFYPVGHERHFMIGHPERPERVEAIRKVFNSIGLWEDAIKVEPVEEAINTIQVVHSKEYLNLLRNASSVERNLDSDTYTTKDSWKLAIQAAGGAIGTALSVWKGDSLSGFALTISQVISFLSDKVP